MSHLQALSQCVNKSMLLINHKKVLNEMFAFPESLKRQEIKLLSPNANISLLSISTDLKQHATAMYNAYFTSNNMCHHWADLRFRPLKELIIFV